MKIITITLNPAIDRTIEIPSLKIGKTNRAARVIEDIGGKGINVSNTLEAFNIHSHAFVFSAGLYGQKLLAGLKKHSYTTVNHEISGDTRLNTKVFDMHDAILTELNDVSPRVTQTDIDALFEFLNTRVDENTFLVLSGSAPTGLSPAVYGEIVQRVKDKGGKVLLDADGDNFKAGIQGIPTIIKPNEEEFIEIFGIQTSIEPLSMLPYLDHYIAQGVELVVVSLGSKGALFVKQDMAVYAKGLSVNVKSTTGAGDALCAALVKGYHDDLPFEAMCRLAIATSAATAETSGTSPASLDRIETLIEQVELEIIKE